MNSLVPLQRAELSVLELEQYTGHRPPRGTVQELHAPVFASKQHWETIASLTHHAEVWTETPQHITEYEERDLVTSRQLETLGELKERSRRRRRTR